MKIKFLIIIVLLGISFVMTGCAITTTSTNVTTATSTTSANETTATSTTSTSSTTTSTTSTTTTTTGSETTTMSTLRVFSLTELATYNGDNGTAAYVAVNGTVYDVTNADEWSNGWHKGVHYAGTDMTAAFEGSPHSESILASLPVMGTLVY